MIIQPIDESDRKELLALFRADAEAKKIWPSGVGQGWYWYWNNRSSGEQWVKLVMEDSPVIWGSVHWNVRRDGWRNLRDIAVLPQGRGRGYGRILVEHIGRPIKLKTDHDSLANGFYKSLGFTFTYDSMSQKGTKKFNHYELR